MGVLIVHSCTPLIVFGCYPIESILRSTLTCLYNQTCLQLLSRNNSSCNHPLDASLPSRYQTTETVEVLASTAFVEEWSLNVSFSNFYTYCNPATCAYSISEKKSAIEIMTIFLGLYGGLTLVLRLMTPLMTNGLRQFISWIQHRNVHVVPQT